MARLYGILRTRVNRLGSRKGHRVESLSLHSSIVATSHFNTWASLSSVFVSCRPSSAPASHGWASDLNWSARPLALRSQQTKSNIWADPCSRTRNGQMWHCAVVQRLDERGKEREALGGGIMSYIFDLSQLPAPKWESSLPSFLSCLLLWIAVRYLSRVCG